MIHLNMLPLLEISSKLLKRKLQINKNVFITSGNIPDSSQENWFGVANMTSGQGYERAKNLLEEHFGN